MAYAQWVIIIIRNVGAAKFVIKNLNPSWGKLHAEGDKDTEVNKNTIEGKVVEADQQLRINACGRSDAAEGTTGSFDLVDVATQQVIRHVYWDCPWGTKRNTFTVSGSNSKWMIEYSGQNLDSGALGTISVDVLKKGN